MSKDMHSKLFSSIGFDCLLLMRQLLFYQGQNGRDHVFGKYLTYNSQSHADLNEVGALKIL